MNILGLNVSTTVNQHDPSAVLIQDGKVIAMNEEERFTRIKHAYGHFPLNAILQCLRTAKLHWEDIDIIGIPSTKHPDLPIKVRKILDANFGSSPRIELVEHQVSHAVSAIALAPFSEGIYLSLDGWGDFRSGSAGFFKDGRIVEEFLSIPTSNSLGNFYSVMTQYLGFSGLGDEFKVMGMSAYGRENTYDLSEFIQVQKESFEVNPQIFDRDVNNVRFQPRYNLELFEKHSLPHRRYSQQINQSHFDFANAVQSEFYRALKSLVVSLTSRYGVKKLAFSGGCALNCAANGKLLEEKILNEIFVQPASTDQGTALGAAIKITQDLNEKFDSSGWNPFLGSHFSTEEIETTLSDLNVKSRKIKNKFEVASRKIRNGSIVGWFQNGAEFGPRALGNRSILADPSNNNIKELVNSRIKYREDFRPFAPAIMEKCARDYFSLDFPSPNMTIAVKAKEFARDMIPGVIHADETARVQTVTRNYNSTFYSLLENFMSETGIPALLNTSFNIKGEPIVNSPRDAIRTFYSSGLDTLVIDDFLIEK